MPPSIKGLGGFHEVDVGSANRADMHLAARIWSRRLRGYVVKGRQLGKSEVELLDAKPIRDGRHRRVKWCVCCGGWHGVAIIEGLRIGRRLAC